MQLEVLDAPPYPPLHAASLPSAALLKPPLIFVHGSLHGAWCFHRFQAFFASRGFQTFAISLRRAGKSVCDADAVPTAEDHIHDLDALLARLRLPRAPLVLGHSMGGFVVQKWVARHPPVEPWRIVLLASTPPSGTSALAWRITKQLGFWKSMRLTMGFVRRSCVNDVGICREMFFSSKTAEGFVEDIEGDDALIRYMGYMKMTQTCLDSKSIKTPVEGTGALKGKVLVFGAELDNLVDRKALEETAEMWEGDLKVLENAPHDLMLYSRWDVAAKTLLDWIESETAQ